MKCSQRRKSKTLILFHACHCMLCKHMKSTTMCLDHQMHFRGVARCSVKLPFQLCTEGHQGAGSLEWLLRVTSTKMTPGNSPAVLVYHKKVCPCTLGNYFLPLSWAFSHINNGHGWKCSPAKWQKGTNRDFRAWFGKPLWKGRWN